MSWTKELFGHEKPVVALLHIRALPGDPLSDESLSDVLAHARADLHALQNGGVDGILFSNEFSLPYQAKTDICTIAAMAYIIGALKSEITIPFGVDVIMDPAASIDLAAATGAKFVRGIFTGAYVGDGGIYNTDVANVLRRNKALGRDEVKLLYFLNCESDAYLAERRLEDIAKSVIFNCHPDVLCISGPGAGLEASSEWIKSVRKNTGDVPVFANTGCNAQNIIEKLTVSDGCCVGTTFKYEGKFNNFIDEKRVSEFMSQVRKYRTENND